MKASIKILCFHLFLSAIPVAGQQRSDIAVEALLENVNNWTEGTVQLRDGRRLKGVLRYDDNSGLLTFRDGDDSRTFTALSVLWFVIQDHTAGSNRKFFSMEYEDDENLKRNYFFEIVKELDSFSLISKVDPINVNRRINARYATNPSNIGSGMEVSQDETLYLMTLDGKIRPYVRIVEREIQDIFTDRKKSSNKFLNRKALLELTGSDYPVLVKFAKEEKLNFQVREDLIRILEHYAEISK